MPLNVIFKSKNSRSNGCFPLKKIYYAFDFLYNRTTEPLFCKITSKALNEIIKISQLFDDIRYVIE